MVEVLIGMGSNIEPERHLQQAAVALRELFGPVRFSTVYRSAAIGMDGDDFLNACCLVTTGMPADRLKGELKRLEDAQGRDRSEGSWKPRTIDLDLLMYGDEVMDDELFRYAHAWIPASELVALSRSLESEAELTPVGLRL